MPAARRSGARAWRMSGVFGQRFGRRYVDHERSCSTKSISSPLRVLPREVGVRLREPRLREQRHHRRPRERLREEHRPRMLLPYLRHQPLPERDRLRVRVVDPEDRHARVAPAQHDVADRLPEPLLVGCLPVEVVDVLVALRRVLRVLERPVGPVLEPLRVLREPRVVGRALEREVERELHPVRVKRRDERGEIGLGAERRVDGVVTALRRADRPGAADVARLGALRVVAALAVDAADRVDRRQVDDVEAELRELRNDLCDACEAAPRAREQLVPGSRPRALPLDLDLERRARPGSVAVGGRRAPRPGRATRPRCRRRTAPRPRRARP